MSKAVLSFIPVENLKPRDSNSLSVFVILLPDMSTTSPGRVALFHLDALMRSLRLRFALDSFSLTALVTFMSQKPLHSSSTLGRSLWSGDRSLTSLDKASLDLAKALSLASFVLLIRSDSALSSLIVQGLISVSPVGRIFPRHLGSTFSRLICLKEFQLTLISSALTLADLHDSNTETFW